MYLPSKLKSRYITIFAVFVFLLVFPFQNAVKYVFLFFSRQLLVSPQKISQKITGLEEKNLALNLELKKYTSLKQENSELRKALNFQKEKTVDLIGAEVISFDPSNWKRVVIINAGENHGIKKGLYAVDNKGYLIGKIAQVNDAHSRLILISDPDFTLPVFVGEKCFGLLKGGLGGIKILYIENAGELKINDKVWCKAPNLTSPIYIGEVKRIKEDRNSLFWDVKVDLFSKSTVLHRVFVIK